MADFKKPLIWLSDTGSAYQIVCKQTIGKISNSSYSGENIVLCNRPYERINILCGKHVQCVVLKKKPRKKHKHELSNIMLTLYIHNE